MSGQDTRNEQEWRRAKMAQIHVAKKQLDMDDDAYRDMLQRITGHRSAALADRSGIVAILVEFERLGFKPSYKGGKRRTTPAKEKEQLVSKIQAQLASAGRTEDYADAISKKAFRVDRFEWLKLDQLYRLAQMLGKDAARHGRPV